MENIDTIVILNDFGHINGGAAKVAIQSAIALSNKGYKVIYFCAVNPIDKELLSAVSQVICLEQEDILSNNNKVHAAIQGIWNKKAYIKLQELIQKLPPKKTVYHVHGWIKALTASIFAVMKNNNIVPFVTLHDYFSICPNGGFYNYSKDKKCNLVPMSIKCLFCNCDKRSYMQKIWRYIRQAVQDKYIRYNSNIIYVYISGFSFSKMKKYLKCNKYIYLKNPCDKFSVFVKDASLNKSYYYIGRMSPEKGIDLFLKAMTGLKLHGTVIGDGMDISLLEEKYPLIKFEGWKTHKQIEDLIINARCLVYPSKCYEGSPLTIPEVLGCGIPCIVPDDCAAAGFIQDGINGYIYKSGNIGELKKAILKMESETKEGVFNYKQWNTDIYLIDKHVKDLICIYKKLA